MKSYLFNSTSVNIKYIIIIIKKYWKQLSLKEVGV